MIAPSRTLRTVAGVIVETCMRSRTTTEVNAATSLMTMLEISEASLLPAYAAAVDY